MRLCRSTSDTLICRIVNTVIRSSTRKASVTGLLLGMLSVSLCAAVYAQQRRPMTPADILRIANVSDAQVSPNGDWVAYTVSTTEGDQTNITLWLARAGERFSNVQPTSRQPEIRRNWEAPRTPSRPLLLPGWNAA